MKTEENSQWITQKEAAELSGKTIKAIHQLTRIGRLETIKLYGRKLVLRNEVLNFIPKKAGRPRKVS